MEPMEPKEMSAIDKMQNRSLAAFRAGRRAGHRDALIALSDKGYSQKTCNELMDHINYLLEEIEEED